MQLVLMSQVHTLHTNTLATLLIFDAFSVDDSVSMCDGVVSS